MLTILKRITRVALLSTLVAACAAPAPLPGRDLLLEAQKRAIALPESEARTRALGAIYLVLTERGWPEAEVEALEGELRAAIERTPEEAVMDSPVTNVQELRATLVRGLCQRGKLDEAQHMARQFDLFYAWEDIALALAKTGDPQAALFALEQIPDTGIRAEVAARIVSLRKAQGGADVSALLFSAEKLVTRHDDNLGGLSEREPHHALIKAYLMLDQLPKAVAMSRQHAWVERASFAEIEAIGRELDSPEAREDFAESLVAPLLEEVSTTESAVSYLKHAYLDALMGREEHAATKLDLARALIRGIDAADHHSESFRRFVEAKLLAEVAMIKLTMGERADALARLEEAHGILTEKIDLSGGAHWRNEARMAIARTYAQAGAWDEAFRTVERMNDPVLAVHALLGFFETLQAPGAAEPVPDFMPYMAVL